MISKRGHIARVAAQATMCELKQAFPWDDPRESSPRTGVHKRLEDVRFFCGQVEPTEAGLLVYPNCCGIECVWVHSIVMISVRHEHRNPQFLGGCSLPEWRRFPEQQ